jgi:hypothetical protein
MGKAARRNWKRVVELWQASGFSKVDFCRKNRIPERKFSYTIIILYYLLKQSVSHSYCSSANIRLGEYIGGKLLVIFIYFPVKQCILFLPMNRRGCPEER